MPRTISSSTPSPVLFTSLLPMNPAINPKTIHARIDMHFSPHCFGRVFELYLEPREPTTEACLPYDMLSESRPFDTKPHVATAFAFQAGSCASPGWPSRGPAIRI